MPYLLDADHCIYSMNETKGFAPQAPLSACGISLIVLGELEYGIAKSAPAKQDRNRHTLLDFLGTIEIYSMSNEVTRFYGELRAALQRQGNLIGGNDLWIAAHALALDLPLATNNTAEFSRVPKLTIETWMNT